MSSLFGILLMATIIVIAWAKTDYCSKEFCASTKHIACGHNGKFDRSCPKNAAMIKINAELQNLMVKTFNEKRNFIAGGKHPMHKPACRMATMEWDKEMAELAELNVKECQFQHDCHSTPRFQYPGQNLYMAYFIPGKPINNTKELPSAVNNWYDEIKGSNASRMRRFTSELLDSIGHFAAMMTDRNNRVGCGGATYQKTGDTFVRYVVTCNFATSFLTNSTIYMDCRIPAMECETGKNSKYPNLCSTSEIYDVNTFNMLDEIN